MFTFDSNFKLHQNSEKRIEELRKKIDNDDCIYIILIRFIDKYVPPKNKENKIEGRSYIMTKGISSVLDYIQDLLIKNKYISLLDSLILSENDILNCFKKIRNGELSNLNLSNFIIYHLDKGCDIVKEYIDNQDNLPQIKASNKILENIRKNNYTIQNNNIDDDDEFDVIETEVDDSEQFRELLRQAENIKNREMNKGE